MREFIRHPSDIPISYKHEDTVEFIKENLKDIGHGGLCFNSKEKIKKGTKIVIKIHIREPEFIAEGIVNWCRKIDEHYEVGVSFADEHIEYGIRMVEQVCHIEHYKKAVLKKEKRTINGQQAALEWVKKNAAEFPK